MKGKLIWLVPCISCVCAREKAGKLMWLLLIQVVFLAMNTVKR